MALNHLRVQDVWSKQAYGAAGNYLGVVEAVGFRHGTVHHVGVPMKTSERRGLRFLSADGAYLDGARLILPAAD
jgi:hypothetical protein